MAWSDPVSAYCERVGPGLTAEPLNALSNIAFVFAAAGLLRLQANARQRGGRLSADIRALPWLVYAIAACSLLFHTIATRWAGSLDSLSILLFCATSIYSFLRHATAVRSTTATAASGLFVIASFALSRLMPPDTLNGSAAYLPNLVVLLAVTGYLGLRHAPAFGPFCVASLVFAIALALRTIDLAWCPWLPTGTHFLWHLLSGCLVWMIGKELTLRRYGATQSSASA